ncbi:MAG: O-antigen ligase family protein [Woeseia sp.]|nr:O-antigen ligase family protein [Woeseia sp.]MBT8097985.1 O-antigen ligase family protein [Woeseia sp.]
MRTHNSAFLPAADRPLFIAYLALLLWLPLPLGSNRIWAWSLMEVWILTLAIVWLILFLRGKVGINSAFVNASTVTACFFFTTLWLIVQTLPLPDAVLSALSPQAYAIHSVANSHSSLSLDVYATRQSVLETLCYLLLFCLTLLLVNDTRRVKMLARVIVFAGAFQAAYGALMTLSGLEYGFFVEKEFGRGVATGTFVNRNHLAGYLEMSLAVGVGLMLAELSPQRAADWRDRTRRILEALLSAKALTRLALVIMVIALVLTRSRMGNIGFLVSLTVVGAFYLFAIRRITRGSLIFFASLLIIDLLIVSNFFGIEQVAERLQQTTLETEERDEVSKEALAMVRDFPLTGIGAGSFYSTYPMYNIGDVAPGFYRHAHNDYLQFAAEFGLPAFALLGFSVLASFFAAIRAMIKRRDRLLQGMSFAATMGILALLIHSAVDFNLQIPANAAMFVVLLALAWICRYLKPAGRERKPWK